jgi:hypothetical protein
VPAAKLCSKLTWGFAGDENTGSEKHLAKSPGSISPSYTRHLAIKSTRHSTT